MNQKITLQDIANSVAEKHGMDKKDADLFVRGIFDLIEEALATENYVKVKGFGTFKLTEVDSRESVDVNTGVRIEIQGHRKVSFQPDAGLKELINRPFSHFENVLLNENTVIEDEVEVTNPATIEEDEVDESVSTQPTPNEQTEIEAKPEIEPEIVLEAKVEPKVEPKVEAEIEPEIVLEAKVEPEIEPEVEAEPVLVADEQLPATDATTADSTPSSVDEVDSNQVNSTPKEAEPAAPAGEKKNRVPLYILLILLAIAGIIYFFSAGNTPKIERVVPSNSTVVEQVELPVADSLSIDSVSSDSTLDAATDSLTVSVVEPVLEQPVSAQPSYTLSTKYEIVGTQSDYTIKPGESLSIVAVKFYGLREFWTYLVKHNAEVITNPDNVPSGTTIKIPELRAITQ